MKPNRNCFSLVELFVFLGVIAVTAVFLSSVLREARRMAGQSLCSDNLKRLGGITAAYAKDYDGTYFMSSPVWGKGPTQYGRFLHKNGLIPQEDGDGGEWISGKYACPELVVFSKIKQNKDRISTLHTYGIRVDSRSGDPGAYRGMYWNLNFQNFSKLKNPAAYNHYGCSLRGGSKLPVTTYYSKLVTGDRLAGIHGGKAGVWCLDGHVEGITAVRLAESFGGSEKAWHDIQE
ncbi:MAG: hypothetical protein BWY31_03230 [Lentisphaerae bacterium ADurb.Bin242]|nr:MAG: hypothetical protein BWY31_03230 [Lentisphaerae bacterium ADurb.Bin242]